MSLESALDAAVAKAIAEKRIVGGVLLVAKDGNLLYEKPHGFSDREAALPMPVDAIFRLASLTKPIIAATILAMSDKGLLRLDDPVTAYMPAFRPALPDGSVPTITLEHLLTHASGLNTAPLTTEADIAAGIDPYLLGSDAVLDRIASQPLLFAPGSKWAYGPSIDVLGVIAGKLVNGSPEDAARRFVLDPLGMNDTRFSVTDRARLAVPYGDHPDGAERMGDVHTVPTPWGGHVTFATTRIFNRQSFQSGGGGMAGTGQDFLRLLECLRTGGAPVMSAETARGAFLNRIPESRYSTNAGWGFGHIGAVLFDPAAAGHPGPIGTNRWGGIYGHNWIVDPTNSLTIVSMTNTGLEGSDGAYRDEICNAVYAALNQG